MWSLFHSLCFILWPFKNVKKQNKKRFLASLLGLVVPDVVKGMSGVVWKERVLVSLPEASSLARCWVYCKVTFLSVWVYHFELHFKTCLEPHNLNLCRHFIEPPRGSESKKHLWGVLRVTHSSPLPPTFLAIWTLSQTAAEDYHIRVLPPGAGHDPVHGVQVWGFCSALLSGGCGFVGSAIGTGSVLRPL